MNKAKSGREVVEMLSSLQEVESVAQHGPNDVVMGWAAEGVTAEDVREAAVAMMLGVAMDEPRDEGVVLSADQLAEWFAP